MNTVEKLRKFMDQSVYHADRRWSKIKLERITRGLYGFSAERIRHLINNLCSLENTVYLELGVFRGSTIIPAAWENDVTCYGIDNFSYNPLEIAVRKKDGWPAILKNLNENMEMFKVSDKINIIKADFNTFDLNLLDKPINVCYYDGSNKPELSYNTIKRVVEKFDRYCILVCADVISQEITPGVEKALRENYVEIHHEIILRSGGVGDSSTWWSGLKLYLLEMKDEELLHDAAITRANVLTKKKAQERENNENISN